MIFYELMFFVKDDWLKVWFSTGIF